MISENNLEESILDFPKKELCPDIWKKKNDEYVLTPKANKAISKLVDYFIKKFKIPNCTVNITGSITSNLYEDDSDIDVHFHTDQFNEKLLDQFNKIFRKEFSEVYAKKNSILIDKHPLEIYFQGNIFQDYMSVGCYDFTNKKWIVGPELEDSKYNPYSEYYKDIQHRVSKIIKDIRFILLLVYEKAVVLKDILENDSESSEIFDEILDEFNDALDKSGKIFEILRNSRKITSSPTSLEDALEKRDSDEWHVADATFKLLDKYGYLALLKEYTSLKDEPDLLTKIDAVLENLNLNNQEEIDEKPEKN